MLLSSSVPWLKVKTVYSGSCLLQITAGLVPELARTGILVSSQPPISLEVSQVFLITVVEFFPNIHMSYVGADELSAKGELQIAIELRPKPPRLSHSVVRLAFVNLIVLTLPDMVLVAKTSMRFPSVEVMTVGAPMKGMSSMPGPSARVTQSVVQVAGAFFPSG